MKALSIFCGSNPGLDEMYSQTAYKLGATLAEREIAVVYGGARVGLMGAVADGALANRGKVIGVLPHFLKEKEIAHEGLSELILVQDMHQRKQKMHQISTGAIALPGGFGTLDELFEILTWGQLGLHRKPVGILNINGFYDNLVAFTDTIIESGFIRKSNRDMLLVGNTVEEILEKVST